MRGQYTAFLDWGRWSFRASCLLEGAQAAQPAHGREKQNLCGSAAKLAEAGAGETIMNTALIWLYEMQGRLRLPKLK